VLTVPELSSPDASQMITTLKRRFLKKGRPDWLRQSLLRLEDERIARAPFYRLHPYPGQMALREVDLRCVVDAEREILYHRIPKNGNSSLVTSITQLTSRAELSGEIGAKRRLKRAALLPSMLEQAQAEAAEGYFKFFVVRNPYDRALSAYLSKVVKKVEAGKKSKLNAAGLQLETRAPSFERFCEFLAEGGLYDDHHWSPQTDYLVLPMEKYDFVARLETIDRDFSLLAERLTGSPGDHRMVSEDATHQTKASSRRAEFYTSKLYDLVYDLYRNDFEAFGYERIRA
jgi:hypothetical protein